MSSYENYDQVSRRYDLTREAVGLEIIIGCLARGRTPLPQQSILDAGCGTGNYTAALVEHVDRISAVDLNPAMLSASRAKIGTCAHRHRVDFHRASLVSLPFEAGVFDGVMVNQVLHHLPDEPGDGYPTHAEVIAELARVLAPGGVLVINTCAREQLRRGFWYYDLIAEERAAMEDRHAPTERLVEMMQAAGLEYLGRFVPVDAVLQGRAYFEPRGPLSAEWRDGDSIWSTVPAARLAQVLERIRALEQDGDLADYAERLDAPRRGIGQMTFVAATRRQA